MIKPTAAWPFTRLGLIFLIAVAMGGLSAGCLNYRIQGNTGSRLQEGGIAVALTNSSSRSAASSSAEAVTAADYCRVVVDRVEIADTSRVWVPVVTDNTESVDLLDPDQALDKLRFLSSAETVHVRSQTYYYVRVHLAYLESDAFDPLVFDPPEMVVKEIATTGFTVNASRNTIMIIDIDGPGAFNEISNPLTGNFEVESVSWMNQELVLIPYSRTVEGRHGVWTTGEKFGYYYDSSLMDTRGNVVGSFVFNGTNESGIYTFSVGPLRGIQGVFQFIRNGFSSPGTQWKGDICSAREWAPFSPAFVPRYFIRTVNFENAPSAKIIMVWANSSDWGFWTADTILQDFRGYFYHLDETGRAMPFGSHEYTQFDTDDYAYRWFEFAADLRREWWSDGWEDGPTIDGERTESLTLYSLTD